MTIAWPRERTRLADPKLNCKCVVENVVSSTPDSPPPHQVSKAYPEIWPTQNGLWAKLRSTVIKPEMVSLGFHTGELGSPWPNLELQWKRKVRKTEDRFFVVFAVFPYWWPRLYKVQSFMVHFWTLVFLCSFYLVRCLNLKVPSRTKMISQRPSIKGNHCLAKTLTSSGRSYITYLFLYTPIIKDVLTWRSIYKEL